MNGQVIVSFILLPRVRLLCAFVPIVPILFLVLGDRLLCSRLLVVIILDLVLLVIVFIVANPILVSAILPIIISLPLFFSFLGMEVGETNGGA